MAQLPDIIIIGGPTASGKSGLALSIAQKTSSVIINADSQQVYKDLRILTARPSEAEEALVPHRLYGTMAADEICSAGKWLRLAKMEIDWARGQGVQPIVVGGTGLYLKALMEGIAEMPDIAPEIRTQAENDYDSMGKDSFSDRLREIDPEFFTRLTVYDRQRLIRAYAVWLGSGKTLSWWQAKGTTPPYPDKPFRVELTNVSREELYARCNLRLIQMIEQGAVEEVKALISLHPPADAPIMKSVGVRELSDYIHGKITLEQAVETAQQATRNYAKRQMTWFRNQMVP